MNSTLHSPTWNANSCSARQLMTATYEA